MPACNTAHEVLNRYHDQKKAADAAGETNAATATSTAPTAPAAAVPPAPRADAAGSQLRRRRQSRLGVEDDAHGRRSGVGRPRHRRFCQRPEIADDHGRGQETDHRFWRAVHGAAGPVPPGSRREKPAGGPGLSRSEQDQARRRDAAIRAAIQGPRRGQRRFARTGRVGFGEVSRHADQRQGGRRFLPLRQSVHALPPLDPARLVRRRCR